MAEGSMDPTIKQAMDQGFAATMGSLQQGFQGSMAALQQGFQAGAVRHNNASNFISEQMQLTHGLSTQLVGAKAAGQLDRDSLAKGVLDARSAAGQPGNAPDVSKS